MIHERPKSRPSAPRIHTFKRISRSGICLFQGHDLQGLCSCSEDARTLGCATRPPTEAAPQHLPTQSTQALEPKLPLLSSPISLTQF